MKTRRIKAKRNILYKGMKRVRANFISEMTAEYGQGKPGQLSIVYQAGVSFRVKIRMFSDTHKLEGFLPRRATRTRALSSLREEHPAVCDGHGQTWRTRRQVR